MIYYARVMGESESLIQIICFYTSGRYVWPKKIVCFDIAMNVFDVANCDFDKLLRSKKFFSRMCCASAFISPVNADLTEKNKIVCLIFCPSLDSYTQPVLFWLNTCVMTSVPPLHATNSIWPENEKCIGREFLWSSKIQYNQPQIGMVWLHFTHHFEPIIKKITCAHHFFPRRSQFNWNEEVIKKSSQVWIELIQYQSIYCSHKKNAWCFFSTNLGYIQTCGISCISRCSAFDPSHMCHR